MAKNGDIVFYALEVNYAYNRKYAGKIGYSEETMKRHMKSNFIKQHQKHILVTLAVAGSLLAYSAVNFARDTKNAVAYAGAKIEQMAEEAKPYAYTNLTEEELRNLKFDDRVALYKGYFDFINQTAPSVVNEKTHDYDVITSNLEYLANEYYIMKDTWNENNQAFMVSTSQANIMDCCYQAANIIKDVYGGKYMITSNDKNVRVAFDKNQILENLNQTK